MRPLSPDSAIIANDLIDNGLADPDSPDQGIADAVNWRRTQHGQDALAQLAEMAPPWRRRVLPADPTPYRIQEIRQHRLNRASTSMQSAPPAPPPALSLSGELAFDPMDFLDIPDTAISASSPPAFQEVANQSELSVPVGESAPPAPPPALSLSGELAFDPMDFLDIPDTAISASSPPAFQEVANQSELSVPVGESAPPAPPPALSLSGELAFDPMDFLDIPDTAISASSPPAFQEVANQSELSVPVGESVYRPTITSLPPSSYSHGVGHYPAPSASLLASSSTHATVMPATASTGKGPPPPGLPSQAPGSSTARPIFKSTLAGRKKVIDPETGERVSKATLARRKKVIDQETGERVSKSALAGRQKVIDPETGERVSKATLARRKKVIDPETGERVSKATLARRKKVIDPETGERVSKSTLAGRKKVIDPETGERVSKSALAKRKKVIDPETGERVSKSALAGRKKVIDPETGERVSKSALAGRKKVIDPETGERVSKSVLAKRQKVIDPETGERVSKSTLAGRQKVIDPETGERVSKSALAKRQKVIDPETGERVSKSALAKRQKVIDPETGERVSKSALAKHQKVIDPETGVGNRRMPPASQQSTQGLFGSTRCRD
ncbi:Xanthomonas outer protein T, type III effector XopT (plasmid) [Xanthomonas fragariae]|nr:Xanthomonas outer protein T, type III effector XopT [Xanthomonas fragariae]